MAKGQKRSNRELKKPKQTKPKISATAGTAPTTLVKQDSMARGKKK